MYPKEGNKVLCGEYKTCCIDNKYLNQTESLYIVDIQLISLILTLAARLEQFQKLPHKRLQNVS
jgi:hypothetical protein